MMLEKLTGDWNAILKLQTDAQRRIDGHPLRLYFGSDAHCRAIFFLRTSKKPDMPVFSSVVSVELLERPEQFEWTVLLTLQDQNFTETFIGLCVELSRISAVALSEDEALKLFYRALDQLRTIFQRSGMKSFSTEEQRGLAAELWLGLNILAREFSPNSVLTAWKGPYGAAQDYRLSSGRLIEVKAVHAESRSIKISSAEQLDPSDSDDLVLAVIGLEEVEIGGEETFSIPGLIREFLSKLRSDDEATLGLEDRLASLKISDSYELYNQEYALVSARFFRVSEGFPRVTRESVPLGIDQLNYRIQLAAITGFQENLYALDKQYRE